MVLSASFMPLNSASLKDLSPRPLEANTTAILAAELPVSPVSPVSPPVVPVSSAVLPQAARAITMQDASNRASHFLQLQISFWFLLAYLHVQV